MAAVRLTSSFSALSVLKKKEIPLRLLSLKPEILEKIEQAY